MLSAGVKFEGIVILNAIFWLPKPFVDGRTCPEAGQLTLMIESDPVQKFCALGDGLPLLTWMVVLVGVADPYWLFAVAVYDVLLEGAVTLIEHAVDEMPLVQVQDVTALPPLHDAVSVTLVPAATAAEAVFGDWLMLQLLGGRPPGLLLPMYTVVENVAPGPEELVGVTVYVVVEPGATVRDEPSTPMFQLYVMG